MSDHFMQKLAKVRADEIFTPEYYKHVTDSWYFDEKFGIERLRTGVDNRKLSKKEVDTYMKYLDKYFDEYKDRYYGGPLAQDGYGKCIDYVDKILEVIEYGNANYHMFEIDDETIKKIKEIGNIFVEKHNEFCNEDKGCQEL